MTSRELTSGFDFWSCGHLRIAVMHLSIKFGAVLLSLSNAELLTFCRHIIKDGSRRHLGFVGGSHGTTHEGTLVVRTPCKNFVMIGSVGFKL